MHTACIPTAKSSSQPSGIIALSLPHDTTSKLVPSVGPKLHVATLAACNDAANSSCTPSVDELRDGGGPNREMQYSSQGLLVTCSLDI